MSAKEINWPKETGETRKGIFGGGKNPGSNGKDQDATFRKPFPNFGKTETGPERS